MRPFSARPVLVVILLAGMLTGCNDADLAIEAPTPSVRMPTRSIRDPLTEAEVQTFLSVLHALPDGQAPDFEPLSQATAREEMSASQLADIFRQEYRAMFDASRHGERWRSDKALMQVFAANGTSPEDFAALMIRMSCAITASTLSPEVDLTVAAEKAEAQVSDLIADVDYAGRGSRTPTAIMQRRESLEALQDLVAFSEFARILIDVPAESFAVVARHRSRLAEHLPHADSAERFERTIDSHIVPTGYHQWSPPE